LFLSCPCCPIARAHTQLSPPAMSTPVIKMAKGRAALANVLNSTNRSEVLPLSPTKSGIGSWESKALSVKTWLKSNPLKLGIPNDGTVESIQAQLMRGDKFVTARQKAWSIILIELASVSGVEGLGGGDLVSGNENADPVRRPVEKDERHEVDPASSPSDKSEDDKSVPGSNGSEGSVNGGGGVKAVFQLRASAESLANVLAAEANDKTAEKKEKAAGQPSNLDIPALSNQSLEHIKHNSGAAPPKSKSARPSAINTAEHVDHVAGSLNSLSARGPGQVSSFAEMDVKEATAKAKEDGDAAPSKKEGEAKKPMTMMERQELWMAKKKAKNDAQKAKAEQALVQSISSHPDNSRSKKSLERIRAKAEMEKMAMAKLEKEREAAKAQAKLSEKVSKDKDASGGGKWNLVKNTVKAGKRGKKNKKKEASAKKEAERGEGDEKGPEAPALKEPLAEMFSPTTAMARRRNNNNNNNDDDSGERAEAFPLAGSASTPNMSGGGGIAVAVAETKKGGKEEEEFVPGSFFTRIDESTRRGHFRVRDGSGFSMSTMYRKRDKYSKRGSAVALLVGTEERGGGDEKVIEVLFDTDKLGEKEAKEWWKENESRFASPKK